MWPRDVPTHRPVLFYRRYTYIYIYLPGVNIYMYIYIYILFTIRSPVRPLLPPFPSKVQLERPARAAHRLRVRELPSAPEGSVGQGPGPWRGEGPQG